MLLILKSVDFHHIHEILDPFYLCFSVEATHIGCGRQFDLLECCVFIANCKLKNPLVYKTYVSPPVCHHRIIQIETNLNDENWIYRE